MIKEAIKHIQEISRKELVQHGEKTFSTHNLTAIKPSSPSSIHVNTLDGFCDFIKNNVDKLELDKLFIHVVDHETVKLRSAVDDVWKDRDCIAHADMAMYPNDFDFDEFMSTERFIINLQAKFEDAGDRAKLLKLVGNVRNEDIRTSMDDGTTQEVVVKSGATLVEQVDCPNPVTLAPFRTFREIDKQPESKFVFRLKKRNEESLPMCGLFEADGGEWKLEAMDKIAEYLRAQNTGVNIIS